MQKIVPAFRWLSNYKREDLSSDLSAGLIVAVILVPQGMAYALLAGLPPVYGLYASTVPAIVYAIFGTSRHMPVGPPALMALLTFASVSALAEPGSAEYVSLALLLALMVGALQLAMGLLRMGFLTNFVSRPVLSGFVYASAVVIALGQAEHLLGIALPDEHSTIGTVRGLARGIGEANPLTLAIGGASIAGMALFAKTLPRFPGPLIALAAATLLVYALALNEKGVGIVGGVPEGLPSFSLPALDPAAFRALAPAALVMAFVGFVESISVAKAVAARERYKIDPNQELRAIGLANVAAAFFSGFPVAGSFSRTAVQHQSGGRTQAASVVSAIAIVAVLLFLTPLFYYLPNAALAAVVLVAVYGLLDFGEAKRAFRTRTSDGLALLITFFVTVLVGFEQGVVAGAAFALLAFVRRTAYPEIAELGYVEEGDAFLGLRSHPEARVFSEALILRFDARLYYANVPFLEEWLISAVADRPHLEYVIIDCRGINDVDVTALEGLEDLVSEYQSNGVEILFTHVKLQIRQRLPRAGFLGTTFKQRVYPTTREALRAIGVLDAHHAPENGGHWGGNPLTPENS